MGSSARRLLLAFLLASGAAAPGLAEEAAPSSPLYDLPLRSLAAGRETSAVTLEAYRGKVILLNFWATWCPPCRAELPDLSRISRRFADSGVVVVGVSLDRGDTAPGHVRRFLKNYRVRYPNYLFTPRFARAFGLTGRFSIPQTFVLDRSGAIVGMFEGMGSEDEFAEALGKTL